MTASSSTLTQYGARVSAAAKRRDERRPLALVAPCPCGCRGRELLALWFLVAAKIASVGVPRDGTAVVARVAHSLRKDA
jgi:hypothetical protein